MTSERIREIIEFIMDVDGGADDPGLLQEELEDLGYEPSEIRLAFRVIESGVRSSDRLSDPEGGGGSRVFGEFEKSVLSVEAQGYLLALRRSGALTEMQLSLIVDSAAFEYAPPVSLDEARELAARFVVDLPEGDPPRASRRDGSLH